MVLHGHRSNFIKLCSKSICSRCLVRNISIWDRGLLEYHKIKKFDVHQYRVSPQIQNAWQHFTSSTSNSYSCCTKSNGPLTTNAIPKANYTSQSSFTPILASTTSRMAISIRCQFRSSSSAVDGMPVEKKSRWSNWTGKNAWKLSLVVLGLTFSGMAGTIICSWGNSFFKLV